MIKLYFILFNLTFSLLGAISFDMSLGQAFNLKQKIKVNDSLFGLVIEPGMKFMHYQILSPKFKTLSTHSFL